MGTLKYTELTSESSISLLAETEEGQADLPVTMNEITDAERAEIEALGYRNFIALDVVVQEWQKKMAVISFQNAKSKLSMLAYHNDELFKWNNISVAMVVLKDGKRIHIIELKNSSGEKYNRRKGVRIPIDTIMDVKQDDKTYKIMVRDISYCGVGIYERNGSVLDKSQPFQLFLEEKSDDKAILVGKFLCQIVRQKEYENGDVESGCIIAKDQHSFMQKYIATKQVERLSGKSGFKSLQRIDENENWRRNIVKRLGD